MHDKQMERAKWFELFSAHLEYLKHRWFLFQIDMLPKPHPGLHQRGISMMLASLSRSLFRKLVESPPY